MPSALSSRARPETGTLPGAEADRPTRLIHLALVIFGIAALISGEFAGDYKRSIHPGFSIHSWCGIGMGAAVGLRILWGIVGPNTMRFSDWFPVTRARLALVWQDIVALAGWRLPARPLHQGLAGLVQAIGLCAFAWMALTGAILFGWLEPGVRASGWLRIVKELHGGGQVIAFAYLALHAGAVVLHALAGHDLWRHMFFLRRGSEGRR